MKYEESLETLLRHVGKCHSNKINKVLDEINMHRGQPIMLRLLYSEDGVPQSVLAKEMEITPATASAMVKRMEKAGFVIRKRNAEDERISNVYLTDAGKAVSSQLSELQNDMEEIVFDGFSEKEKFTMKILLQRILENLKD
jgi:MarR family transcriptional repressor of mepA